jgi:menaquinone-dependent protoporphyrinogen oxidase
MAKILILYSTTDGHTREIARRIAEQIAQAGHAPTRVDVQDPPAGFTLAGFDAAIVGASIHMEKHQRRMIAFVRERAAELARLPGAFFSVCMTAAGTGERDRAHARAYIDRFVARTGWQPANTASFAGAVLYTRYGFLKRLVMRQIMKARGRDTDTTRDFVYTDWQQVADFTDRFLAGLATGSHPPREPRHADVASGASSRR